MTVPKAAPKASRERRQRGSINAEEIIVGAFEVARRESLDQLSMPALAEHLGVGVTSIYWYFRKKDDLLNAMSDVAVDTFIGAMPPLPDDQPWQDVLFNFFRNTREVHRRDMVIADLLLIRTSSLSRYATNRVFELAEGVLGMLVDAGFTTENAFRIFNAASVYSRGMIIHDRILRLSDAAVLDERQRKIADWSTMPLLESQLDHSLAGTSDEDFAFGMGRLICGFEAVLREQRAEDTGSRPGARQANTAKPGAKPGARSAERTAPTRTRRASLPPLTPR
jgi:AcrR family transcriptional regulator